MIGGFRSTNVLVTGGLGFIGSHLVEALVARKAQVTVFDNGQSGSKANIPAAAIGRISIHKVDVRNCRATADLVKRIKPALVFHLAANASVPGSVVDPAYDFETNCGGTFNLLHAVKVWAPRARVILASSGAVYGEPRCMPITETTPLCPISPYGASKVAAETECRMFNKVYGVDVVIARIFNTYGPRMPRFVVLDFLKKLRKNESELEILGDGRQVRDFNYVQDTVAGLLAVARSGQAGQAYNLASGKAYTVTELAGHLLRILKLGARTKLVCTGRSWAGDAQHWEVDISKIRKLGYRPGIPLDTGLKKVVVWFDEQCGGNRRRGK